MTSGAGEPDGAERGAWLPVPAVACQDPLGDDVAGSDPGADGPNRTSRPMVRNGGRNAGIKRCLPAAVAGLDVVGDEGESRHRHPPHDVATGRDVEDGDSRRPQPDEHGADGRHPDTEQLSTYSVGAQDARNLPATQRVHRHGGGAYRPLIRYLTALAAITGFVAAGWLSGTTSPLWLTVAIACLLVALSPIASLVITLWLCDPRRHQEQVGQTRLEREASGDGGTER